MSTTLRALFVACLTALAVVSGCVAEMARSTVRGSGVSATETRGVANFSEVRLSGSGDVFIEQAGTESLSLEAEDNILPLLETTVENGVLHLGTKDGVSIHATRPIRYRVTVKNLTGVGVSGSGNVRASGVDTDRFAADISGSGSARLAGRADEIALTVSGSGSYDAAGLRSKAARVSISGSGDAIVNASDRLEANVSGSGSVHYSGNPAVEKRIIGSGVVTRQ